MRDLSDLPRCAAMRMLAAFGLALLAGATLSTLASHATAASTFTLDLSGVRFGTVRAESTSNILLLVTQDVTPALATLLDAFVQRKPVKRDVRLTSGAVMRKANDANLVSMKLPALGRGGPLDVELAFAVTSLSTQPLLSAKESSPSPTSARIASFRIDVGGMQAIEAPKLDAITLTRDARDPDLTVTSSDVSIEVAAGGAAPFAAWKRVPNARTIHIEYIAADGRALLALKLDRCKPANVTPQGANGTTRITLACAGPAS